MAHKWEGCALLQCSMNDTCPLGKCGAAVLTAQPLPYYATRQVPVLDCSSCALGELLTASLYGNGLYTK